MRELFILIINLELFSLTENTYQEKDSLTTQSIMLNGKEHLNTAAGKESDFLRRPSGKKLHEEKMEEYIHGVITLDRLFHYLSKVYFFCVLSFFSLLFSLSTGFELKSGATFLTIILFSSIGTIEFPTL